MIYGVWMKKYDARLCVLFKFLNKSKKYLQNINICLKNYYFMEKVLTQLFNKFPIKSCNFFSCGNLLRFTESSLKTLLWIFFCSIFTLLNSTFLPSFLNFLSLSFFLMTHATFQHTFNFWNCAEITQVRWAHISHPLLMCIALRHSYGKILVGKIYSTSSEFMSIYSHLCVCLVR